MREFIEITCRDQTIRSLKLGSRTRVWELTAAMTEDFRNWLDLGRHASERQQPNSSGAANEDSINLAKWLFSERSTEIAGPVGFRKASEDNQESDYNKEEDSADERGAHALRSGGMMPLQVHMILDWAGCRTEFDPSVGGQRGYDRVMRSWRHFLQHVPVRDLKWTHDSISSKFAHGPHGGNDMWSLYDDLCIDRFG